MRILLLVSLVALGAWAQSTGGTFGSGGLSGGGSSSGGGSRSTGGGSRSTGGSKSTGGSSIPSFDRPRQRTEPRQKTPAEILADEQRAAEVRRREADFQANTRLAGAPQGVENDPRVRVEQATLLGLRPPHFGLGLGFAGLVFGVLWLRGRREYPTARSWELDFADRHVPATPRTKKPDARPEPGSARGVVVSFGFDWTVRGELQAALKALSTQPMEGDVDRMLMAMELVKLMRTHARGIRYAQVREVQGSGATVEAALNEAQAELRARYTHETVGAARQLPEVKARPLEGPGMLVLSVLFGALDAPETLGSWMPLDRFFERLELFGATAQMLNVVWSPAVDGDRLSSAELEVLYPELERVGPARLGRVACGRCNAVYALELERCPSCGAQEDRSAGKTPAPPCPWCGTALPSHETKCGHCGAFVEAPPPPQA